MDQPLSHLRAFCAELLGYVLNELFPGVQLVKGGVSSVGFYYDCIFSQSIRSDFLPLIENRFAQLGHELPEVELKDMMRENAEAFFLHHEQPLLATRAAQSNQNIVGLIKIGDFFDLYPIEALPEVEKIRAFKLLDLSPLEIYEPALGPLSVTRITGTVFHEKSDLKTFLKKWTHYKKGDHQKFGQEMGLFQPLKNTSDQAWIFFPRGEFVRDFILQQIQAGYKSLGYQKIGISGLIPENFYPPLFNETFRSHLEWEEKKYLLPTEDLSLAPLALTNDSIQRFFETKTVMNAPSNDQLEGLFLTRSSLISSAHFFCSEPELLAEMISCLQFIARTVKVFGFEHQWILYPKVGKKTFSKNRWLKAVDFLEKALEACGLTYQIETTTASLTGPRIEIKWVDSLGRTWIGPQLEVDFYHSEHNVLTGQTKSPSKTSPFWGVRWNALGSIERVLALLLEQQEGYLPLWIAPEQVRILPVGENGVEYAKQLKDLMIHQNLRVFLDERQIPLGERIFAATQQKVPYLVIVGNQEKRENRMTVRSFGRQADTANVTIEDFLAQVQREIKRSEEHEH